MKLQLYISILFTSFSLAAAQNGEGQNLDGNLQKLMEGNQRFVTGKSINPRNLGERRKEFADYQSPFAVIFSCSDSRVPPEMILDQNLGEIFVVRVAGNALGRIESDSIEYAVEVLGASFIMVMGHQKCGAVEAVLKNEADEQDLEGIVPYIKNAIKQAKKLPGDPLTNAIKENVRETVKNLKAKEDLKKEINKGRLKIVGAYYSFDTGKVELL